MSKKRLIMVLSLDIVSLTKWTATVITLMGAICTSFMIDPLNIILLNLGAFLFLIWGFLIRDRAMITVNGGLLFIYFLGIILRL